MTFIGRQGPVGQMVGSHTGPGRLTVADWWLVVGCVFFGVLAAAAAAAAIRSSAKMRMMNSMDGYLWWIL
jgi:hypothetical protein